MTAQRFHVSHRTTYEYSLPMNDGYTLAVVMPRQTPLQTVEPIDPIRRLRVLAARERGDA